MHGRLHQPDEKIDRSARDRKYPFSQFHNLTGRVTEKQNVGNSSRSSPERVLGDAEGLAGGGDQTREGKERMRRPTGGFSRRRELPRLEGGTDEEVDG